MGKLLNWDVLFVNQNGMGQNNSTTKKPSSDLKERAMLDQLNWLHYMKKNITDEFYAIDSEWFNRVIRGAKYSVVGEKYMNEDYGIECVRIVRPKRTESTVKAPLKRNSSSKKETSHKRLSKKIVKGKGSPSNDSEQSKFAQQTNTLQQITPPKSITDVPAVIHQTSFFDQSSSSIIDVLNYDFSFTSPLIKST